MLVRVWEQSGFRLEIYTTDKYYENTIPIIDYLFLDSQEIGLSPNDPNYAAPLVEGTFILAEIDDPGSDEMLGAIIAVITNLPDPSCYITTAEFFESPERWQRWSQSPRADLLRTLFGLQDHVVHD